MLPKFILQPTAIFCMIVLRKQLNFLLIFLIYFSLLIFNKKFTFSHLLMLISHRFSNTVLLTNVLLQSVWRMISHWEDIQFVQLFLYSIFALLPLLFCQTFFWPPFFIHKVTSVFPILLLQSTLLLSLTTTSYTFSKGLAVALFSKTLLFHLFQFTKIRVSRQQIGRCPPKLLFLVNLFSP